MLGAIHQWVFSNNPEPYNSFGNGAAMRIQLWIAVLSFMILTSKKSYCQVRMYGVKL